ncbi:MULTISPECIES: Crp/Fnr family transcriptional regulator [unclassified Bradyrhizobium]|uniref:Crp/Fnr family transcriptional regulator n=1 Tax=unclassified Bradyrhizobium TaxID=2631580 RepID=UPI00247A4F54|nr:MULTISPECIES: Crp/Fnr family transcriptional regulator [unclassified Bradyrhizobium]WGR72967.1 Crp/Fnr family transcriptional regulator [Bradyrhizobium sp. ISRA426]WGR77802.1 Crp/Fnr family transcriptional regulator [Bradyrhizobium sp. ISRA430]WGR88207.1 Crp/Fnr family transcriptional regulator [Bradyrhizobium sp. ISRA432]
MTSDVSGGLDMFDISGASTFVRAGGTQVTNHHFNALRSNTRFFVKNTILAALSLQDLAAIGEFLEPVVLRERMLLQEPKRHLDHVYFVESGLVSLRIVAAGSILETATIGSRGAVGATVLFGGHVSTYQTVVLFPGSAHRIHVEDLYRLMDKRPEIREHLLRYVQALSLHSAQTGLCGVRHDREKRLASWICLASDAVHANVLPVTHEYLSSVLGLRRAGVTETLNRFEEEHLIRKTRGVLQIGERRGLEQKACSCYKLISGAYAVSGSTISHFD